MNQLLTLSDLRNIEEANGISFPDSFKAFALSAKSWEIQLEKRFPYGQFFRAPDVWKKCAGVLSDEGIPFFINFAERTCDSRFKDIALETLELKADSDVYVQMGESYVFPDIYLFESNPSSNEPKVKLFSVHTIVHEWKDFSDWLAKEFRIDK